MEFSLIVSWILSAPSFLVNLLSLSKPKSNHQAENLKMVSHRQVMRTNSIQPKLNDLAARLNFHLEILKESYSDGMSVLKVCKLLEINDNQNFSDVFKGKVIPSPSWIEEYLSFFGLNENWLLTGSGEPFTSTNRGSPMPYDNLKMILDSNFKEIFWVRSDTSNGESMIVLKLSDYKYEVIRRTWHVSSEIGGEGTSQLKSLYDLGSKLKEDLMFGRSKRIDSKLFSDILSGKVFPGVIEGCNSTSMYWMDDLIELDFDISDLGYDSEYCKARKILRNLMVA